MAIDRKAAFLAAVCRHVRWPAAHRVVRTELASHIDESAAAYRAQGLDEETAAAQAVAAMGDAQAIGQELDSLHRPQLAWPLLALTALLATAGLGNLLYGQWLGYGMSLKGTVLGLALGSLLLLGAYFYDYRRLLAKCWWLYGAGWLLVILGDLFGVEAAYGRYWIRIDDLMLDTRMLAAALFILAMAGLLVRLRDKGQLGLLVCMACCLGAMWAVKENLAICLVLFVIHYAMLFLAVGKGYFGQCRAQSYEALLGTTLYQYTLLPMAADKSGLRRQQRKSYGLLLGLLLLMVAAVAWFFLSAPHRISRLRVFFTPDSDPAGGGWQAILNRTILQEAGWLRLGGDFQWQTIEPYTNDVFVNLVDQYGYLAGAAALGALALLFYLGYRLVARVRSNYGFLLSFGALTFIAGQAALHILVNINLMPITAVSLPFFSQGGTGMLLNGLLLGLVLSVWRRNNLYTMAEEEPLVLTETPEPPRAVPVEGFATWQRDGKLVLDFGGLARRLGLADEETSAEGPVSKKQ